jgi:hypothetical protein
MTTVRVKGSESTDLYGTIEHMFRFILPLTLALLPRHAEAQVDTPPPPTNMGNTAVDTSSQWAGFWLDGGVGLTGVGPLSEGAAHVMLRRWVFTLGVSSGGNRNIRLVNLTNEWEAMKSYHLMVSYLLTSPTQRTQLSLGVGGGYFEYTEHLQADTSASIFAPAAYTDRKSTAFDLPIRFETHFFADSPLGLYVALSAHMNIVRSMAAVTVGVRLLPITR